MKRHLTIATILLLQVLLSVENWGALPARPNYPYVQLDGETLTFYYEHSARVSFNGEINWKLDEKYNTIPEWGNKYGKQIKKVVFESSFSNYKPTSTAYWFGYCSALEAIEGIENLNTSNVADMSYMFFCCSKLNDLDVTHFDTRNVKDIHYIWGNCESLEKLDVSHLVTTNVTDMNHMFYECSSLKSLDVSNFDTSNVTDMHCMFAKCSSLTNIDLTGLDTRKVTKMWAMFAYCKSLTELDVSHFDTSNVTGMGEMFMDCNSLTSLDITNFITNKVTSMDHMFMDCVGLTSLDLSSFDTSNVKTMGQMFGRCSNLTILDLSEFDTSNVTQMYVMFSGCTNLTTIYCGSKWNTKNVTESDGMFKECTSLVGGKGTKYDKNHTDASYAHIDGGKSNPGYLTAKDGDEQQDISDSDELLDYINSLIDYGQTGTVKVPVEIPISPEGLDIDKDVEINDELQAIIDGLNTNGFVAPVTFSQSYIFVANGCGLSFRNIDFCGEGGGISNSGTIELSQCNINNGNYKIENLQGATMKLTNGTTLESGSEYIFNRGDLYVEGNVSLGGMKNLLGGRIYITSPMENEALVAIDTEEDLEPGEAVITGSDGYTLTEDDYAHFRFVLPNGYEANFDATSASIIIICTDGISLAPSRVPATNYQIYDFEGRKLPDCELKKRKMIIVNGKKVAGNLKP